MKRRNYEIDSLRGIAIILLVSYHIIGGDNTVGLKISDGYLRDSNDVLSFFRMPLFTFLSGSVYSFRPFKSGVTEFIKGKARRLLIPMLVVGTLFAIIQSNTPGVNHSVEHWHLLHLKPYLHFWFVESLFLIFLLIIPLEMFKILDSKVLVIALFSISSIIYISEVGTVWFSISGAIYLFPYFILGMAFPRFSLIYKYKSYWSSFFLWSHFGFIWTNTCIFYI